jgi:predicted cobalt transporter CbtA
MTYPEQDPERTRGLPPQPLGEEVVADRVEDKQAKRVRTVRMVCSAVTFVCALFAVVLVAQIILVLAEANPHNGFASFVDGFSSAVSLGLDGLFNPGSAKAAVLFNYGTAAILWLLISAAVTFLIRRFALPGPRDAVRYRRALDS